jgi:hypothetical protein
MPIWVTEFGLATSRTGPDGTLSGLDVTEEQQAAWLATAIRQAAAIPYIACFATYMLHDHAWADSGRWDEPHDNPANWQVRFGLVSWDNAREKPAWKAVTSTIASLPPPTEAG